MTDQQRMSERMDETKRYVQDTDYYVEFRHYVPEQQLGTYTVRIPMADFAKAPADKREQMIEQAARELLYPIMQEWTRGDATTGTDAGADEGAARPGGDRSGDPNEHTADAPR